MSAEENIKNLKINLPDPKDPVGSYVASRIVGKLLYVSGQISINDKGDLIKGKLGKDLNVDETLCRAKVWNHLTKTYSQCKFKPCEDVSEFYCEKHSKKRNYGDF